MAVAMTIMDCWTVRRPVVLSHIKNVSSTNSVGLTLVFVVIKPTYHLKYRINYCLCVELLKDVLMLPLKRNVLVKGTFQERGVCGQTICRTLIKVLIIKLH